MSEEKKVRKGLSVKLEKGEEKEVITNMFTVKTMLYYVLSLAFELSQSGSWLDDEQRKLVIEFLLSFDDNELYKDITQELRFKKVINEIDWSE